MPHFDEFYANKLRGALGVADADAVLDLRGASADRAAASLQDMLERSRFGAPKAVAIRLDAPTEGGGETLFQPIGKALLEAKKRGWIDIYQPGDEFAAFLKEDRAKVETTLKDIGLVK